jgi:hypothetical protein
MTNRISLGPILLLLAAVLFAAAQTPTPTPAPTKKTETAPASAPAYTLTELQRAHLHEAQLTYFIAARDLQQAGDDFNRACNAAKTENHWPDGVQCSVKDLSIIPPAAAAEKNK